MRIRPGIESGLALRFPTDLAYNLARTFEQTLWLMYSFFQPFPVYVEGSSLLCYVKYG